jgi:cellobiose-specific phosphotransferase system component IIA
MDKHIHAYKHYAKDMLICHGCNTVSTIRDALENAKELGKDELRTELVMSHSLKKFAHDATYKLLQSKHFPVKEVHQERMF